MANEATAAAPELATIETKMNELAENVKDIGKVTDRLDKLEAKMNRPANDNAANDNSLERKAFNTFIRRGVERMPIEEAKALTVATDASAGYLAPEQFGGEIFKKLVEFSPIRRYARVVTIGASEIKYPRRTSGTTASWVAETADRTESEPAYEQVALAPFELASYTDISNALLEDNAYNLQGELSADFGESFGLAEGGAFVKGNGTTQPSGLMTDAGISFLFSGNATGFPAENPADVIIDMFHALPGAHAQNSVWLMNRTTLGVVRKWKDGEGRYLVLDPISEGAPTTLLGRPVVEAVDMDDIGANNFPVLFGDMQGYRIVDRVGLSMLRDPYSLATKGQTRIHARKRVGGGVTHPNRFVKLKCAVES